MLRVSYIQYTINKSKSEIFHTDNEILCIKNPIIMKRKTEEKICYQREKMR